MKVVLTATITKQIRKLDRPVAKKILDYLEQIEKLENPRDRGKILVSNLSGIWRYRVGDYRILCRIIDEECIIYALEVGHRKEIYN